MQISYIRGTERVIVDRENKTAYTQRLDEQETTQTDYASFVSVRDNFRDNDKPYIIVDDEGPYVAIPFCAETEQDKINHRNYEDSQK